MADIKKKIVFPGDFIGTEEEYLAGDGTFSDGEKIYTTVPGQLKEEGKRLCVERQILSLVGPGTIVIGKIENIVEPIALVSIQIKETQAKRFSEVSDYAVLHASRIKRGFVRNVRSEYKIGDIIRAKVVEIVNGEIHLSTDDFELGAIKAFCAKCRRPLVLEGRILKCEECGFRENRKIAADYRKANL